MEINELTGRPILDEYERENRTKLIAGLRAALDFYEARPNMPAPNSWIASEVWIHPMNKPELQAIVREAGSLTKKGGIEDDTYELRREFSDNLVLRIFVEKHRTCERVKVGEKVIEAQPERIIPAVPEKVVEVYEWKCDSVLAPAQPTEAARPN